MVIIEGPKGSGKTTLVTTLSLQLNLPTYNYNEHLAIKGRFDIQIIRSDVQNWGLKPFGLYDGHPLIEEYIYGPLFRKGIAEDFALWEVRPIIQFLWQNCVIIYCRPGNYSTDNISALPYFDLLFRTPLLPIIVWEYDFTNEYDLNKVATSIRAYKHSLGAEIKNGRVKRRYTSWGRNNDKKS